MACEEAVETASGLHKPAGRSTATLNVEPTQLIFFGAGK